MEIKKLKNILEAVLLAAEHSLTVIQLEALFELDEERPTRDEIRKALHEMTDDYESRGFELKQVASGFRLQVRQEFSDWVGRLWEEKPARYTRALLETMALIAYRQPVTRGEIEEVRGVSVSSNIIKTLLERDWIKVLGHKDVPGKPTLYGTTKEFLDYFNLQKLDQLPTLAEIKDLDSIHPELELDEDATQGTKQGGDNSESDTDSKDMSNTDEQNPSDENDDAQGSAQSKDIDLDADAEITEAEAVEEAESVMAEANKQNVSDEAAEDLNEEADTDSARPVFNV